MIPIHDFQIVDFGVCQEATIEPVIFQMAIIGVGTDAESALDDLHHKLGELGCFFTDDPRDHCNLSTDEGDGETMYRVGLRFDVISREANTLFLQQVVDRQLQVRSGEIEGMVTLLEDWLERVHDLGLIGIDQWDTLNRRLKGLPA